MTVSGVGDFDLEREEWRSEGLRTGWWFLCELLCVDEAFWDRADDGIALPPVITGGLACIYSSASCWPGRGWSETRASFNGSTTARCPATGLQQRA